MHTVPEARDIADLCGRLSSTVALGQGFTQIRLIEFDIGQAMRELRRRGLSIRSGNEGEYSLVAPGGTPGDFSRTSRAFDFHTDGLYFETLPRFVLLHCIEPGLGYCTTQLSDGSRALNSLSESNREIGLMLDGVYIGRAGEQYYRPIVQSHPTTGKLIMVMPSRGYLRPTALNPSTGAHLTIRDIATFTRAILTALDEAVVLDHSWTQGDVLMFDNFTYVHARKSLTEAEDAERRLHRVWLDA